MTFVLLQEKSVVLCLRPLRVLAEADVKVLSEAKAEDVMMKN